MIAHEAPESEGFSVVRLRNHWFVACRSDDLGSRPIARTVADTPLVLFRAEKGNTAALLDRCAHRNVPLSLGRIVERGRLECAYHGWQYDADGFCQLVPALRSESQGRGRRVPSFPVREQQGFVWVFVGEKTPDGEPYHFPALDEPGYTSVRFEAQARATLHATLENMLDVPHTAFLHRGLFRGGRRNEITAVVRRWNDHVEAEYVGEPPPTGLAARILAGRRKGALEHYDRFFLPSISQVEYRLGERSHLVATTALTPVSAFETRFFLGLALRLPFPVAFVRPFLTPVLRRILRQDNEILAVQTDTVRRFGSEEYVSTEVDVLGPHIWRLLRQAEAGIVPSGPGEPIEKRVPLLA